MSTTTTAATTYSYFRRRRLGRASSPPTWACYEQIQPRYADDYNSDDDSSDASDCVDHDDRRGREGYSDSSDSLSTSSDSCSEEEEDYRDARRTQPQGAGGIDTDDIDMDMGDDDRLDQPTDLDNSPAAASLSSKDIKGKQKAPPEPSEEDLQRQREKEQRRKERQQRKELREKRRREKERRREREPVYALRPILTIQRSQGFVWNQDLFVPPYIKDRYIASTSPPNSKGFISTSASSTNSALTDCYDTVEVVEIRIKDGERLCDLIG